MMSRLDCERSCRAQKEPFQGFVDMDKLELYAVGSMTCMDDGSDRPEL